MTREDSGPDGLVIGNGVTTTDRRPSADELDAADLASLEEKPSRWQRFTARLRPTRAPKHEKEDESVPLEVDHVLIELAEAISLAYAVDPREGGRVLFEAMRILEPEILAAAREQVRLESDAATRAAINACRRPLPTSDVPDLLAAIEPRLH